MSLLAISISARKPPIGAIVRHSKSTAPQIRALTLGAFETVKTSAARVRGARGELSFARRRAASLKARQPFPMKISPFSSPSATPAIFDLSPHGTNGSFGLAIIGNSTTRLALRLRRAKVCREAAAECNKAKIASRSASAKTVCGRRAPRPSRSTARRDDRPMGRRSMATEHAGMASLTSQPGSRGRTFPKTTSPKSPQSGPRAIVHVSSPSSTASPAAMANSSPTSNASSAMG